LGALLQEKEKLEIELKRAEEVSQERSVTVGNLKNELLTAQDQLKALDVQMTKDREKLLKLREDKKILLDKVAFLLSIRKFVFDGVIKHISFELVILWLILKSSFLPQNVSKEQFITVSRFLLINDPNPCSSNIQ